MTKPLPRLKILSLVVTLVLLNASLLAQSPATEKSDADPAKADRYARYREQSVLRSYPLQHVMTQNEANEILIALRNLVDPQTKIYLVASQNVIEMSAPPEQQQMAQQIVHELDRAKQNFRLTYTFTQLDSGKRVGTQHYSMVTVPGQLVTFKQGSKVPVMVAGVPGQGDSPQYQYLDVGMNFNSTINLYGTGLQLRSKIEQSSIAEEKSNVGLQDPVVRQTVLEGTTLLVPGKPAILGSVDVPDSTRRIDVEVMAEPIP